ncbi:hypothetical protein BZA77DRAFT_70729 [Pyronema omphalodes]|nr:hypothetical protein BZA77DRAFT_70729 [Pyronema omphalodes]
MYIYILLFIEKLFFIVLIVLVYKPYTYLDYCTVCMASWHHSYGCSCHGCHGSSLEIPSALCAAGCGAHCGAVSVSGFGFYALGRVYVWNMISVD